VDHDVAQTLAALERKLAELERELMSIGREGVGAASQAQPPSAQAQPTSAHAQPPSAQAQPISAQAQPSTGVLVDEAVQQRFSMEARETVFGEIPATKDERQSIDLGDLVRFREKMQSTLQGLIDEYSSLLSLQPPPER
jgi:hypothetical protein